MEAVLTRCSVLLGSYRGLVASDALAESFVAGADSNNGQQAEDQRSRAANVPLAEYDAEVGRVPCEEHLFELKRQKLKVSLHLSQRSLSVRRHPMEKMAEPEWVLVAQLEPWCMRLENALSM